MFRIVSIGNSFECPSAICLQHRLPSKYERCFLYQIVVARASYNDDKWLQGGKNNNNILSASAAAAASP